MQCGGWWTFIAGTHCHILWIDEAWRAQNTTCNACPWVHQHFPLFILLQGCEPWMLPLLSLERNQKSQSVTDSAWHLNKYHLQIDCILRESGYLDLQRTGLIWNLTFRGKSFPVVCHPYVSFISGDTKGHNVGLCGHYKSCTAGVAQLCWAFECPAMVSGYSKARDYGHHKPHIINRLVCDKKFSKLKAMSQQYLVNNAFNNVWLGMHNDRGIFGACPGE